MVAPPGPPSGTPPRELPQVLAPVAEDLAKVGTAYEGLLLGISPRTRELLQQTTRFSGKRLRPALTCLAARTAGGTVSDDVAAVAAIVELIHTATLVHDDVLDGAEVRRRRATVNARWGDGLAVLVGDVLFTKAYLAAAWLEDRFASRYLAEVVDEILEGEIHQDLVCRNAELEEAEYRRIIRGKTAALYEGAMVVGGHYGGRPELGTALGRFGHHLGMAFQIVDDRLDLTGDETSVGKTLGRDLGEGKTTLPLILWRDSRPPAERAAALATIESAWDDPDAAAVLCGRLAADGALHAADAAARAEADQALAALEPLPDTPEKRVLATISAFILDRVW